MVFNFKISDKKIRAPYAVDPYKTRIALLSFRMPAWEHNASPVCFIESHEVQEVYKSWKGI